MKRIIVIIISVFTSMLYAEDVPLFSNGFNENYVTYVFAENVRIRTAPGIKEGNVIDALSPGHEVLIIKSGEKTFAMNGFSENWLYVKYRAGGREKTGYVWGGLLSIAWVKNGKDLFLTGIRRYSNAKGLECECRVFSGGKIISSLPVVLHSLPEGDELTYRYSVEMKLHDSRGLGGLQNVISIYSSYGACGYPRGNVWIGYASGKLYYIGTDTGVSEAGVFHVEEKFIFPADDKTLKDQVRIVTENFEFDEELGDYKLAEKKERIFVWKNFRLEEMPGR